MLADAASPRLGADPVSDVGHLFDFHFMVNALAAGTIVAVLAAVVGWFIVARRQAFVAHTLTTAAFPGAAAALLVGISAAWGYFSFCLAGALAIGLLGGTGREGRLEQSSVVGAVQALGLALGFALVGYYHGILGGLDSLLFGSFLGISDAQVLVLAVVAAVALALVAAGGRRLWFASVDPDGAVAAGVPVRELGILFLALLGLAVAAVSQITGALLIFTLLVVPAATAAVLTDSPARGLALSVAIALVITWIGLGIAYYSIRPVGFWLAAVSLGVHLVVRATRPLLRAAG